MKPNGLFPIATPRPRRDYRKVYADLLKLAAEAKRDPHCVAIEDALDGKPLAKWERLVAEMKRELEEQPS